MTSRPRDVGSSEPDAAITMRSAGPPDVDLLATLNQQLITDQNHHSRATDEELRERMTRWVAGDYAVTLMEQTGSVVAYAVWRRDEDGIYLRQFFVARSGGVRGSAGALSRSWSASGAKAYRSDWMSCCTTSGH